MAKTILIVDDSADIRRAVCDLFKREQDFMVCGEAANGREGIVKALELHPDLIVLDLSTPCARAALGETPASLQPPFIAGKMVMRSLGNNSSLVEF